MASLNAIGGLHYEMMRRCYNDKSVAYKDYGAKGIEVCEEWHDRETFRKWCLENGWVKGLKLNRIDGSKNYCPENCYLGTNMSRNPNSYNQRIKRNMLENKQKKLDAGIIGRIKEDDLYVTYHGMHSRCERKSHPSYHNYGGRGISVCDEWSGKNGFFNFKKWATENGWHKSLSLDRKDNEKGYSPDNCKFSTIIEQNYNRRSNILYEYAGMQMPLGMIAKLENVKYQMLYYRVKKGYSLEDALNEIKNNL